MKRNIFLTLFAIFALVGCDNNLQWSKTAPDAMDWNNAINYCKNLSEGGHNDWRLPSIDELRTLIQNPETTISGKCRISEKAGKLSSEDWDQEDCLMHSKLSDTGWFWSSSVRSDNSDSAWYVNFGSGDVNDNPIGHNNDVRCVRQN